MNESAIKSFYTRTMSKSHPLFNLLKVIALLKAFRGLVALGICLTLTYLLYTSQIEQAKLFIQSFAEKLQDPVVHEIIGWASKINDNQLRMAALLIGSISLLRISEALGLWSAKCWAEWLALVTSLIGIPLEMLSLLEQWRLSVTIILITNVLISIYLGWVLWKTKNITTRASVTP